MSLVMLYVNGEARTVANGTTVEQVVAETTPTSFRHAQFRGVAAAVNGEVIPRREWGSPVKDGDRVEIVTAVQGG